MWGALAFKLPCPGPGLLWVCCEVGEDGPSPRYLELQGLAAHHRARYMGGWANT